MYQEEIQVGAPPDRAASPSCLGVGLPTAGQALTCCPRLERWGALGGELWGYLLQPPPVALQGSALNP